MGSLVSSEEEIYIKADEDFTKTAISYVIQNKENYMPTRPFNDLNDAFQALEEVYHFYDYVIWVTRLPYYGQMKKPNHFPNIKDHVLDWLFYSSQIKNI